VELTDSLGGTSHCIFKRLSLGQDWIMRTADDTCAREVAVWHAGVLDALPAGLTHAVVAAAQDGDGWPLLMADIGPTMVGDTPFDPLDVTSHERVLASLHATFWQRDDPRNLPVCWCSLRRHYALLSPQTGQAQAGAHEELLRVVEGWVALRDVVAPQVAAALHALHVDPGPLCAALGRLPRTLIHGDYKLANLGVIRGERTRVALLDWALVGWAAPAVDLAWYLALTAGRLPVPKEEAIAQYYGMLAHRLGPSMDERCWQPQLDLALLGGLLRAGYWLGWLAVRHPQPDMRAWARREIAWWETAACRGIARL
jgi:aminoglycoside/choline kinase family phosphotransferase